MLSAQRERNRASSVPSANCSTPMWTQPVLSGTSASCQVRPPSAERRTALVSWLPTQRSPGRPWQYQMGSRISPLSSTVGGWRTNAPEVPTVSNSVSVAPQWRPPSVEMRRRTIAVS